MSRESLKPFKTPVYKGLISRPTFYPVLKPEEHRAVLWLFVSGELEMRKGLCKLVREERGIKKRLHAFIMIQVAVN